MQHHGEALRRLTHKDTLVDAVRTDPDGAELAPRQRALVDYALKLTRRPSAVTEVDLSLLKEAGLDDPAIHDLAAVTAYFNFVNRMALGLGVELEPEE